MIFLKYLLVTFVAGVNVRAEYILIQWLYNPFPFAKSQTHFS